MYESNEKILKEKEEKILTVRKKIFGDVFDDYSLSVIFQLAKKGFFHELESVISPGKEALVCKALDMNGNYRAVKIYKIETSDFRNMEKYLDGDRRFKKIGRTKKEIVFNWTKKEFKNLNVASEAGVNCPTPIAFQNNVLVMSFIGNKDEKASLPLKQEKLSEKELEKIKEQVIENYAKALYIGNLVHADFSEYNILVQRTGKELNAIVIDWGQAVLKGHPQAKNFFERDLRNISNYFSKKSIPTTVEELKEELKTFKETKAK